MSHTLTNRSTHSTIDLSSSSTEHLVANDPPPLVPLRTKSSSPANSVFSGVKWFLLRKDCGVFAVAIVLISGLSSLFAVYALPQLVSRTSIAFVPVFAWLWLASLVHLFKTSLTDPGYLPLNLVPMATSTETSVQQPLQDVNTIIDVLPESSAMNQPTTSATAASKSGIQDNMNENTSSDLPSNYPFINVESSEPVTRPIYQDSITVYVKDIPVQIKYCYTCQIWRPPRSSHCRACNRCVENHDHHCPWTGTCIGKHNYRHFINFILTTSLLSAFVCSSSVIELVLVSQELTRSGSVAEASATVAALELNPVLPILIVMTGMFALALGGMVVYHVMISAANVTTHEDIRRKYQGEEYDFRNTENEGRPRGRRRARGNPFDQGGWKQNLLWVLCRPAESSYDPFHRFETQLRQLVRTSPVVSGPTAVTTTSWRRSLLQSGVGAGSGVEPRQT
ncbi:DHHC palmitoyltransferase-domain-containing protein [Obelidium mucronatum]|nr:DHHC palmitoyltransferase-domain-containing protein [Obelidium mucronatum]